MKRNRLLSLLVLLMTAVTGAWATTPNSIVINGTPQVGDKSISLTYYFDPANVPNLDAYAPTLKVKCAADNKWDEMWLSLFDVSSGTTNISLENLGEFEAGKTYEVCFAYNNGNWVDEVFQSFVPAVPATTYSVTLAEGTEDADNWTISPNPAEEGSPVTVTYSGERKVKSVKAVKKASGPEVTTFSELQAALSAGKDVKLMNDIVCTAEIEITSDGALTIDGNGKTLSTTSAIRAFKVGSSATVAFKNLTLTGFVNEGGPAINNSGTIVLDGCTISNCHVSNGDGGGAIENKGNGKLYAINTTFSGNYSGEIGGAINNYRGSLYMSGCTFTNNYTADSDAYYGGAIGINGGDEVRLINCSFSGNQYGTNTGTNDIGVFNKPEDYTIAGCTGATIASSVGDITTIASGTATLDYSDLSNISFTYKVPVTVTWNSPNFNGNTYTQDGVTCTPSNGDAASGNCFYDYGANTFTTTLGKFTKIEIVCTSGDIDGWTKEAAGQYQPDPVAHPDRWKNLYKLTWTGDAESVTIQKDVYGIQSITFNIQ